MSTVRSLRTTLLRIGGVMSYEPPLDDDIALDLTIEDDDGYQEPDRMWGDE
jgi:hypothetical protein